MCNDVQNRMFGFPYCWRRVQLISDIIDDYPDVIRSGAGTRAGGVQYSVVHCRSSATRSTNDLQLNRHRDFARPDPATIWPSKLAQKRKRYGNYYDKLYSPQMAVTIYKYRIENNLPKKR